VGSSFRSFALVSKPSTILIMNLISLLRMLFLFAGLFAVAFSDQEMAKMIEFYLSPVF
jgi:hypothetical protein